MNIARDKQLHIIMGAAVALAAWGLVELARHFGIPIAMGIAAAAVGVAYEVLQGFRNEGEPDPVDAAFTAGGGVAATLLVVALVM